MNDQSLPTVGVVVPTRDRPELLRRALASIAGQTYAGQIQTVVVYDGTDPDMSIETDADFASNRPVRVLRNDRTSGLAGTRNTGILDLDSDFVAFCDDDDHWLPTKIERQVQRATQTDRPEMVTCAIIVDYDGRYSDRLAGADSVRHSDLTRSILAMLHSSCFFFDRTALVKDIGLVDETIPGSQNEDWDIKLRAAARRPIAHIDQPLTVVQWGRTSSFARRWDTKNASLRWMLCHHPEIAADRRGAARVYGQLAFGHAASGERTEALRWVRRTVRADPRQWRAGLALVVTPYPPLAERVLDLLHRFGRGV